MSELTEDQENVAHLFFVRQARVVIQMCESLIDHHRRSIKLWEEFQRENCPSHLPGCMTGQIQDLAKEMLNAEFELRRAREIEASANYGHMQEVIEHYRRLRENEAQ